MRDGNGTLHRVTPGKPLHLPTRHPAATPGPAVCSTPVTNAAAARCIDISGGDSTDGTPLQLYDCNGSAAQTWSLPGDGTVRAMAKCMDVRGGSDADGTPVQIYTCNSSASQQWTYVPPAAPSRPRSASASPPRAPRPATARASRSRPAGEPPTSSGRSRPDGPGPTTPAGPGDPLGDVARPCRALRPLR